MFIPPAADISPARQRHAENGSSEDLRGTVATTSASLVPTLRQTVSGVEVIHPSSNLPQNYHSMPQARIYHPKQAPSAVTSENFLTARRAVRKFSDVTADGACFG